MGKIVIPQLTIEQCKELAWNAKVGDNSQFRVRCQSVLLKAQGKTSREIKYITGLSYARVPFWVKRYQTLGIEGLQMLRGENRKPK